jgi:hypothetical protein
MGCERCHLEGAPTLEDGRARAAGYAGAHAPAGPRGIAPGDAFSHALHAGEREISCVQCHAPLERQVDGRDHAPVSFDTCRECHTTGLGRDADVVFPEAHGAEACQWCHADPEGGELRQVQTLARRFVGLDGEPISLADDRPRLLFSFASHGHVDEVRARRDDCADCHHRRIDSIPRVDRPFWHALHLPPRVLDGSLPPDAVRATCAQCHAAVVASDTLAGIELPYDGGDASGCARCHASERNRLEAPSLSPGMTTSETTRPDFPHERHANLGCLECHPMGSPEDYRAVPAAPFEVRTCVACHDDHASLPSCEQCHSPAESIFSSDAPPARDYGSFSHLEPGHRTDDCMRCHTNAADATRISEVELPSGDGAACFECHFGERYHWR